MQREETAALTSGIAVGVAAVLANSLFAAVSCVKERESNLVPSNTDVALMKTLPNAA